VNGFLRSPSSCLQQVANTPVEDQEGLVQLICKVYNRSGIEVPKLTRALELTGSSTLARNMKRSSEGDSGAGHVQKTSSKFSS
jgi:hypothetical protein